MLDHFPTTPVAHADRVEPRSRAASWTFPVTALGLLGVAFALRFWDLARAPVWMDEAFTYIAAQLPLKTILFGQIDNHPPLFYALQHVWQAVDPRLSAVRVPAAVAGGLAVLATMLASADLVSRRAGLLAGLFLALSTSQNYFSQDARMYPLLTLGLTLATWGLVGMAQRSELRWRYGGLYVLGGAAAVYTQAVALLFLASLNLALLAGLALSRAPRRVYIDLLAANLALGALSLPWLVSLATAMGGFRGLRRYPAGLAAWFLASDVGFPASPAWARKPGLLLLAVLLVFGAGRACRTGPKLLAAAGLAALVVYPLMLVAANVATPVLEHRVFTPCAVGAALLFGAAVDGVRPPQLRYPILAAYLAMAIFSLVLEHRTRVKPEDVPRALARADAAGFAGASILACDLFPAMTLQVTAPERRVFFLTPSLRDFPVGERQAVRMDARFPRALSMSMIKLHAAGPREFAPYLGASADARANAAELQASDRIVVVNAVCGSAWTDPFLERLRFVKTAAPPLQQPANVVFSNVWTRLELWRRAGPPGA